MNKYSITVSCNDIPEVVEFELSDRDLKLCNQYIENFDRLKQTSIVKNGFLSKLKIELKDKRIAVLTQMPNDEDISAFLHRLRFFILKNEPASFFTIARIIGKNIENETIRADIKDKKRSYQGNYVPEVIQIFSNGVPLLAENILNKRINAFEYNQDQDKRREIEDLYKNIGGIKTANAVNLMLLTEKLKSISSLASFLKLLFVKSHAYEIKAS